MLYFIEDIRTNTYLKEIGASCSIGEASVKLVEWANAHNIEPKYLTIMEG